MEMRTGIPMETQIQIQIQTPTQMGTETLRLMGKEMQMGI